MSATDDPSAFSRKVADEVADRGAAVTVAMCSGGHDSTAMLLRAAELDIVDVVAHCNTGIGLEQSRDYVRETAAYVGASYIEALPPGGNRYADIVFGDGHPGATRKAHQRVRQRLKGRAKDKIQQSFNGEVVFLTGVRRAESDARWDNLPKSGVQVSGRSGRNYVWANPITTWLGSDVTDELQRHDYPRNSVKDYLGHSGECLCGSFDSILNLGKIGDVSPEMAHCLLWFMGFVIHWYDKQDEPPWPRQYLIWGHGGLKDRELRALFDKPLHDPEEFVDDDEPELHPDQTTFSMCSSCSEPAPEARDAVEALEMEKTA